MDASANRSAYKKIEDNMAEAIANGSDVDIDVGINYFRQSKRPKSFKVKYCIDGLCTNQLLEN